MTSTIESGVSLVGRVGGTLAGQLRSAIHPSSGRSTSGWLAVTVLSKPGDIDTAHLSKPLAEFGDRIEVRVREAPDGKGTELAARLREQEQSSTALSRLSGNDAQADLRSALRRAKQLIEVGEVLVVDPAPHGKRTSTPAGVLLEAWTKAASRAGVR